MGLYLKLIEKSILSKLEYRMSFYISVVSMILYYVVQFSVVVFTVYKFKSINGWHIEEISFLYAFILLAQGTNTLLFGPLIRFDELIRKGEWDYLLIRPFNPFGALLCMKFDPSAIAQFFIGIVFFIYSVASIGIGFSFLNILMYLQIWIGGSLILASIRIFVASIAFFAVSIESLVHFFVYSSKEFIMYPINIYKSPVPFLLTFILPLAFINYYPVHIFLEKDILYSGIFKYFSLPVGMIFIGASALFFRYGMKKYHSTGT